MEKRYQQLLNGQSVIQSDLNTIAEAGSLADDRVFADLLRMAPYGGSDVARGVIPYRHATTGATTGIVVPAGATGTVAVRPFRAFIGSRTAVGTDAKASWRDVRSTIYVASTTTLTGFASFAANASGMDRWDLVYAAITPDANASAVSRKVKDPTTGAITAQNVVVIKDTTVAIGVVTGTPGTPAVLPSIPADAAGTYYIPLAYVLTEDGFGASTTIDRIAIRECAPVLPLSTATGAVTIGPATGVSTVRNRSVTDHAFMPSTMCGGEDLLVTLDLRTASTVFANRAVIDSRDWRNRICHYTSIMTANAPTAAIAWLSATVKAFPGTLDVENHQGVGQSFHDDNTAAPSSPPTHLTGVVASAYNGTLTGAPQAVFLYVDITTGELKVFYSASPNAFVFFWLRFSAPYPNAL